jgi:hypothetical protein
MKYVVLVCGLRQEQGAGIGAVVVADGALKKKFLGFT